MLVLHHHHHLSQFQFLLNVEVAVDNATTTPAPQRLETHKQSATTNAAKDGIANNNLLDGESSPQMRMYEMEEEVVAIDSNRRKYRDFLNWLNGTRRSFGIVVTIIGIL